MKNYHDLKKPYQNANHCGSVSNRLAKKILYLTVFAGTLTGFTACMTSGYVETAPMYVNYSRPPQPSNLHIWIDGDWGWNRSSHTYVQKNGHWKKPNQRRTYTPGHWEASSRGQSWESGRWERNRR